MFVWRFFVDLEPPNCSAYGLQVQNVLIAHTHATQRILVVWTAVEPGKSCGFAVMVDPVPLNDRGVEKLLLVGGKLVAKIPEQARVVITQHTTAVSIAPGSLGSTAQVRGQFLEGPATDKYQRTKVVMDRVKQLRNPRTLLLAGQHNAQQYGALMRQFLLRRLLK